MIDDLNWERTSRHRRSLEDSFWSDQFNDRSLKRIPIQDEDRSAYLPNSSSCAFLCQLLVLRICSTEMNCRDFFVTEQSNDDCRLFIDNDFLFRLEIALISFTFLIEKKRHSVDDRSSSERTFHRSTKENSLEKEMTNVGSNVPHGRWSQFVRMRNCFHDKFLFPISKWNRFWSNSTLSSTCSRRDDHHLPDVSSKSWVSLNTTNQIDLEMDRSESVDGQRQFLSWFGGFGSKSNRCSPFIESGSRTLRMDLSHWWIGEDRPITNSPFLLRRDLRHLSVNIFWERRNDSMQRNGQVNYPNCSIDERFFQQMIKQNSRDKNIFILWLTKLIQCLNWSLMIFNSFQRIRKKHKSLFQSPLLMPFFSPMTFPISPVINALTFVNRLEKNLVGFVQKLENDFTIWQLIRLRSNLHSIDRTNQGDSIPSLRSSFIETFIFD